jgi:hypothetical protein
MTQKNEEESNQNQESGSSQDTSSKISEKYSNLINQIKDENTVKKGKTYFKEHLIESIVGIILVLGFIISIFFPLYGGTLVCFFAGITLSPQCVRFIGKLVEYYQEGLGIKCFTVFILGITVLLILPVFVIAFFVGFLLRWALQPSKHSFKKEKSN